jgi:phosphate transport system protein
LLRTGSPERNASGSPRRARAAAPSGDADLALLRQQLLTLGEKVEAGVGAGLRALLEGDSALARDLIDADGEIDRLELEVDETCRRLLMVRQSASALRLITAAVKIVVDLERMGDLAVNIARRAIELNQGPPLRPSHHLWKLADLCHRQVRAALGAFIVSDVARAQKVIANDELVDARYHALFNELIGLMMEDAKNIRGGNSLLFVAKHLERIGDHAVNVAEMVIFTVKGKDIRHPRSRAVA